MGKSGCLRGARTAVLLMTQRQGGQAKCQKRRRSIPAPVLERETSGDKK